MKENNITADNDNLLFNRWFFIMYLKAMDKNDFKIATSNIFSNDIDILYKKRIITIWKNKLIYNILWKTELDFIEYIITKYNLEINW